MSTTSGRTFFVLLAVLNVVLVALGTLAARVGIPWLGVSGSMAFLSFMAAAVGIVTFFGLLWLVCGLNNGILPDQGLRTSITVAVITVYLVVVGEVAFFGKNVELAPVTDLMLTSFTSIVGVVVAFFFGASAYVEAQKGRKDA